MKICENSVISADMDMIFHSNNKWEELNNKSILVTGPYGMLASYMVLFLCYLVKEKGYNIKVITVGRNKTKFEKKFGEMGIFEGNYLRFVESDLSGPLNIDEPIDYIIHAASLASPQYYGTCPVDVIKPNVIGNYNMLQLAVEKEVSGYLLFSTGDIYGKAISSISAVSECDYGVMDTLDIHNCYGESKRMAEALCKAFYVQYDVPVKIARIWHTYAPTMDLENDPRVFASFVRDVLTGHDIQMKSDGSGKRSFCYITDAVAGFFKILLEGNPGEAYNVCNESQYISVLNLAEKIVALRPGKGLKVVRTERSSKEAYVENSLLKGVEIPPTSKKLQRLGWNPTVDVRAGFDRVISYKEGRNHDNAGNE